MPSGPLVLWPEITAPLDAQASGRLCGLGGHRGPLVRWDRAPGKAQASCGPHALQVRSVEGVLLPTAAGRHLSGQTCNCCRWAQSPRAPMHPRCGVRSAEAWCLQRVLLRGRCPELASAPSCSNLPHRARPEHLQIQGAPGGLHGWSICLQLSSTSWGPEPLSRQAREISNWPDTAMTPVGRRAPVHRPHLCTDLTCPLTPTCPQTPTCSQTPPHLSADPTPPVHRAYLSTEPTCPQTPLQLSTDPTCPQIHWGGSTAGVIHLTVQVWG